MRLYGYHRGRPTSSDAASISQITAAADSNQDSNSPGHAKAVDEDEEEFREMYYATYKAATFALRKNLRRPDSKGKEATTPALQKDHVRDVVDELLRLFCEG